MSSGSCSPLPRKHGGHCVQHALWLARAGAKAFLPDFFFSEVAQFQIWASMHLSITREPDGYLRRKCNRIPSSAASCNPIAFFLEVPLQNPVFLHPVPKGQF